MVDFTLLKYFWLVNSFMTGSRGTIFAEVLFVVGYLGAKGLLSL
jgi:hypothetical protein